MEIWATMLNTAFFPKNVNSKAEQTAEIYLENLQKYLGRYPNSGPALLTISLSMFAATFARNCLFSNPVLQPLAPFQRNCKPSTFQERDIESAGKLKGKQDVRGGGQSRVYRLNPSLSLPPSLSEPPQQCHRKYALTSLAFSLPRLSSSAVSWSQNQSGCSIKLSTSGWSLGVEENIWRRKIFFCWEERRIGKRGKIF